MKILPFILVIISSMLFSNPLLAGVYKCTDSKGNTSYQSAPCAKEKKAATINIQTGGVTDLAKDQKQKELELDLIKQKETEQQQKLELIKKREKEAIEQSELNQQLIINNPIQFTAFAIPPYTPGNLPELVKKHQHRLPEIEKFRRLAAQKALATGECNRVESDDLSVKSKHDLLIFSVDCSSAKTFYFNESEL